ncbi:hypothetical protein Pan216_34030 [Planctomycetes bacterium Pan216]|uniref:DUF4214 domain-containing protein n=1 Tax=Kolteria novifilia TaxID=2527975 RepID=A0A518B6E6_9BACT|nr:hypothetical protein Pan216_34030 [Planctomycetes bacterium Pan216]
MSGIRFEQLENRIVPTNTQFVEAQYVLFLGREGSSTEVATYVAALDAGQVSRSDVSGTFATSAEFFTRYLEDAYVDLLLREASQGDINAWLGGLVEGTSSMQDVTAAICASQEYFQTRGNNDAELYLDSVATDLLGRPADATLEAAFLPLADAGNLTAVADGIEFSLERAYDIVDGIFVEFLGREADDTAKDSWTPVVQNNGTNIAAALVAASEEAFLRDSLLF